MDEITDDQLHVWEILSCPYVPPSDLDSLDPEALRRIVDEIKKAMIKEPIYQTEKSVHYTELGMTREEYHALR